MTLSERRARWATMAQETRRIVLGNGRYVQPRACTRTQTPLVSISAGFPTHSTAPSADQYDIVHDIGAQIEMSRQATTTWPHYSEILAAWRTAPPRLSHSAGSVSVASSKVALDFSSSSLLTITNHLSSTSGSIGVLLPVSPKKAGGSYLNGGDDHEASFARSSSLIANLESSYATGFYQEQHRLDDRSGLRSHSLVYCSDVIVFRHANDNPTVQAPFDNFITPYKVNVVAASPVNAAAVWANHTITSDEKSVFAEGIRSATKERIARSLRLFEERGVRTLVLPPFGAEDGMNVPIDDVAGILAELLVCGDEHGPARFQHSFDNVTFAVRSQLLEQFQSAFDARVLEEDIIHSMSSN